MKLNWSKHWFIFINTLSCLISMIDVYIWRGQRDGGFPIFGILGCCLATAIGGIYKLLLIIVSGKTFKSIVLELILLWFSAPFYGFLGMLCGMVVGSFVFG